MRCNQFCLEPPSQVNLVMLVLQLPQTVSSCWQQLTAALLVLKKLRRICATSGHRSGARLHSLLGLVSLLRCSSRVHTIIARLHACSLVGMATPSLTSYHVMLQLRAAEHKVVRLVAVVESA